MLILQLRPCYKIVYPGLKRRLLAYITPSERLGGYTSEVHPLTSIPPWMRGDTSEAAFNEDACTISDASHPGQPGGETTSAVLEDSTFDKAILSSAVDIQAETSTNPQRASGDAVSGTYSPTICFNPQVTFQNTCAERIVVRSCTL